MKREMKLNSQQQQQQEEQVHTQAERATEFATPEEMLRHDALQTPVPPAIGQRLQQSVSQIKPLPKTWWQRLLGS